MAGGLDAAAAGRPELLRDLEQVGGFDARQQRLGETSFFFSADHELRAQEMAHVLLPELLRGSVPTLQPDP